MTPAHLFSTPHRYPAEPVGGMVANRPLRGGRERHKIRCDTIIGKVD